MKPLSKTLRQLLDIVDLVKVYDHLYNKHTYNHTINHDRAQMEVAYANVIKSLCSQPTIVPEMPLIVSIRNNGIFGDDESYIDVGWLNKKYEAPPIGYTPYYGDNPPPAKHYNANDRKYHRIFGILGESWSEYANAQVVIEDVVALFELEIVVAEILWEITFYGFSEEKSKEFKASLDKRVEDIKSGKAKTIELKDALKQLKKKIKKKSKKSNKKVK